MQNKKELIKLLLDHFKKKDMILFSSQLGNQKFTIETNFEDEEIIKEMFKFFSDMDIDILEYSFSCRISEDISSDPLSTITINLIELIN